MIKVSKLLCLFILFQLILSTKLYGQIQDCAKCDTSIVNAINKNWEKVTSSQLERFLCTFSRTCHWANPYYMKLSYEMLIVELNIELNNCIELISKNKDIDFKYILELISMDQGNDLPYSSIIDQLDKKLAKNEIESQLLKTLQANSKLH